MNNLGGYAKTELGYRPFDAAKVFAFAEGRTNGAWSAGAGFRVDF